MIFSQHISYFLKCLFNEFPREVGFPWRLKGQKKDSNQIAILCDKNHKENPCFISLYERALDKFWVDFDDKETLNEQIAFNDARTYYKRLIEEIKVDPQSIFLVYTGKKGFHIYVLNKREVLTHEKKSRLHLALSYLTRGLSTVDRPLFANTNCLTRVAGVQRPNGLFTICLDPAVIFGYYSSIYEFFKEHGFNYNQIMNMGVSLMRKRLQDGYSTKGSENRHDYLTQILETIHKNDWKIESNYQGIQFNKQITDSIEYSHINQKEGFAKAVDLVLKASLSRSDYFSILTPNPQHKTRIRVAKRLLQHGFSVNDITEFFSSLGWIDFVWDVTFFHIGDIQARYL